MTSNNINVGFRIIAISGAIISAMAVILSTILVLSEVIARTFFHTSTLISVEFSSYLLIVITFLGLAYTQQTGQMIHVDLLFGKLKNRTRAIINALRQTAMLTYTGIVLWYVAIFTWHSFALEQVSSSFLRTPQYIPQLFMVIGIALLMIEMTRSCLVTWYVAIFWRYKEV